MVQTRFANVNSTRAQRSLQQRNTTQPAQLQQPRSRRSSEITEVQEQYDGRDACKLVDLEDDSQPSDEGLYVAALPNQDQGKPQWLLKKVCQTEAFTEDWLISTRIFPIDSSFSQFSLSFGFV